MTEKRKTACFLTAIPVLAVMAMIFYFSSQTAEASTSTSGGFVDKIMGVICVFFSDLSAEAYQNAENIVTFIVRKSAHFIEFAFLGFFMTLHINTYVKKRFWLISGVLCVLYAVSDEFHQNFVSDRAPKFFDVCVDSLGSFCAIAVACLAVFIYQKFVNEKLETLTSK